MSQFVSYREFLSTDLTEWVIGPYHSALPGPMRVRLNLDGEVIVSGEAETGFLHRGLEKAMELQTWHASVSYADRVDPENAAFAELALCLAVEDIGGISVPARAQTIRVLLCELARISGHLSYIVKMARAVGSETIVHYVLRERERVLDLFELLTGARFSIGFLRFGGVAADVTDGFIERVLELCELIRVRLKEYNDIFSYNRTFLQRTAYVGVLPADEVIGFGVSGPNARASGSPFDVRRAHPYCGYQQFDFEVPMGQGEGGALGDTYDRYLLRLREITQSLGILKQAAESMPSGDFVHSKVQKDFVVPSGEAYSRVESSRGLLGCHVVSDGGLRPSRVQFRVPSLSSISLIPSLVVGAKIEDVPVILAGLDLSIAEIDR